MHFLVEHDSNSSVGLIENIKKQTIIRVAPYVKTKGKSFSISLIGIGKAYSERKNINGTFPIKLVGNHFADNSNYLLKITNNKHIELIIKKD